MPRNAVERLLAQPLPFLHQFLYLDQIELAQAVLGKGQVVNNRPIPEGTGVVAASSGLNTGFGFSYFSNLHIGATSWYLIAVRRSNPYQLWRDRLLG